MDIRIVPLAPATEPIAAPPLGDEWRGAEFALLMSTAPSAAKAPTGQADGMVAAPPLTTDEMPDESPTTPKDAGEVRPQDNETDADHYAAARDFGEDTTPPKSDESPATPQLLVVAARQVEPAGRVQTAMQPKPDPSPIADSFPVHWSGPQKHGRNLDTSANDWTSSFIHTSIPGAGPTSANDTPVLPTSVDPQVATGFGENGRTELTTWGGSVPAPHRITLQPNIMPAAVLNSATPSMHSINGHSGVEPFPSRAIMTNTTPVSHPAEPALNMIERGMVGNSWIDSDALPPAPEMPQLPVVAPRGSDLSLSIRYLDALPGLPANRGMPLPEDGAQPADFRSTETGDALAPEIASRAYPVADSAAIPPISTMRSGIAVLPTLHTSSEAGSGAQGNPAKDIIPFLETDGLGHAELRFYTGKAEPGRKSEGESDSAMPNGAPVTPTIYVPIGGKRWTDARIAAIQDEDSTGLKGELMPLDGVTEHRLHMSSERLSQLPSPNAHPTRQLADAIVKTSPQQAETELVLTPEELGKVRFAISQQDGVLTIVISADRPDTLALLRRNADMLSADLARSGLGDATLDFGASGRDRGHHDERPTWAGTSQSTPIELPEQRPRIQPVQRPAGSGRIDLRL